MTRGLCSTRNITIVCNSNYNPAAFRTHFADIPDVVTIPKTTPPGQYLMRVEHIYPSVKNDSQFYVNCAQVNIVGPGGGELLNSRLSVLN